MLHFSSAGSGEGRELFIRSQASIKVRLRFSKFSLSARCSRRPLGGAFCSSSICVFPIGCDIKLNTLLTGK